MSEAADCLRVWVGLLEGLRWPLDAAESDDVRGAVSRAAADECVRARVGAGAAKEPLLKPLDRLPEGFATRLGRRPLACGCFRVPTLGDGFLHGALLSRAQH